MEKNQLRFNLSIYCVDKQKRSYYKRFFKKFLEDKINRIYNSPNINLSLYILGNKDYFEQIKDTSPAELAKLFNNIGSVSIFPTYELFCELTHQKVSNAENLYLYLLMSALIDLVGNCLIQGNYNEAIEQSMERKVNLKLNTGLFDSTPELIDTIYKKYKYFHIDGLNKEIEDMPQNKLQNIEDSEDILTTFINYDKSSTITHYGYSDKIIRFKELYIKLLTTQYLTKAKALEEINKEFLYYYGMDIYNDMIRIIIVCYFNKDEEREKSIEILKELFSHIDEEPNFGELGCLPNLINELHEIYYEQKQKQ